MKIKAAVLQSYATAADAALRDLTVLFVDCQTTGARPSSGHLLEAAWAVGSAGRDPGGVEVHRCRLPEGASIPPAVQRLTGIKAADTESAVSPVRARRRMRCALSRLHEGRPAAVAVIHYARFEAPFLDAWFDPENCGRRFPLQILCTHEIARRLYPELPRRGIRALAGYFGRPVSGRCRAAAHVRATHAIWSRLVTVLGDRASVHTLDALLHWLERTPVPPRAPTVYPMPASVRSNLPKGPGIYRMRGKNGGLLYIGKAASIRRRVSQHFHRSKGRSERRMEMLTQAANLDAVPTETALEAALLESDEIKRERPPYNKALQAEQRSVWFFSLDCRHVSHRPDRLHCIGPMPDVRTLLSLRFMADWIQGPNAPLREGEAPPLWDLPAFGRGWIFREDAWQEGLSLFLSRNGLTRNIAGSALQRLVDCSHRLWRKRWMEAVDSVVSDVDTAAAGPKGTEEQPAVEQELSPETVAHGVEAVIRRAGQGIRRARWFCLLSESSLCWSARNSENAERNGWILRCAGLSERVRAGDAGTPPVPPGWQKGCRSRQQSFDVAAYDRMRVLTTELRRLLAEHRAVTVRCGPNHLMEAGVLAGVLRWL
ncbi:MAG: GIY-YIG nuclease family protein [Desulfobacteraceae bacterium]|nr:GIY-YIG nuclease family protein [Desulfobacteraceae bacterium]